MEKNNNNKHEIVVKFEGEVWKNALNQSYIKNNKKAKIDGFRPGKAPYDIFVKHFGVESLYEDAIDSLVQKAYEKALDDSKLIPVVQPALDIKKISENEVEFTFVITTKPDVKIKKYKGLNVEKQELVVTDEEIEHEIEHLLEQYSELVVKEGVLENGDTAVIDYEGFVDGVAFEGGKADNYSLEIGSNTFIPGFEEQLIGMEKETEKEIEVEFPKDYHSEELKGKKAIFKVVLHEIKTREARELDKEFFEDLGMDGVDSEETLKTSIKEHIETHKKTDIENKFVEDMMDAISKNTEVDIPEEMVNEEVTRLVKRAEENLRYQGISLDLYYQFTKSTEEDLKNQLEPEAFKNVLYRLILEEIIKLEEITVTEEEIKEEISKMASKYNAKEEEIINELGGEEMIKYDLEARHAFDKLAEYNKK